MPHLKEDLRRAHITERPDFFVKKILKLAFFFSLGLSSLAFFIVDLMNLPLIIVPAAFVLLFILFFAFFSMTPKNKINKRKRELDREVLFAGRFLLVKVHSGRPLLNALVDASESYGVSSKYFKEIVEDINMGTPIEDALDHAVKFSPSAKFRRVIFQINSAIKIGVDVTVPLQSVINELTAEQFTEIQRYGKKLNSLALFYMLLAVVMPSLGMAMFVVIGGLVGIPIERNIFLVVASFLVIIQFIFMSIFKTTRLSVNL